MNEALPLSLKLIYCLIDSALQRTIWLTDYYMCSPYAAHVHNISDSLFRLDLANPQGLPGALSSATPGPTQGLDPDQMNKAFVSQKQAISDRLEAESKGYDSVFAQ